MSFLLCFRSRRLLVLQFGLAGGWELGLILDSHPERTDDISVHSAVAGGAGPVWVSRVRTEGAQR